MFNHADESVQFRATGVFSFERRGCSVYSDDTVQFKTAMVFNSTAIFSQIIVVTHNANIVLGADAEQVIVANQNGKDTPNNDGLKFEYRSGALEENDKELNDDGSERIGILSKKGIQTQICDILEGGRMAFELRKNKYSVNRNT